MALQHEWIQCRETVAPRKHLQEVVDNLRRYNQRRELKSSVLTAVNAEMWKSHDHNVGVTGSFAAMFGVFEEFEV
ncbi:hypothetical protein Y032_0800g2417 [Ancylostoma ceylanicum]|uniref:Uncharacterized protein n=1 Tax=Ancylostoma ceylanicum TaxID=53326 RepID=A0A016WCK9_9BILA|nr:hypothetical protein Y032_0800g2417 [Ancylostoma ceylanicum]